MAPIASAKEPSLKSESPHTPYQCWFSAQKMPTPAARTAYGITWRRGAQPAAAVQQHHQHAKGSRNGKRQQKQPGIFTVQVTAGKANARCQQPRPNGCLLAGIKHSPQRRPRHTGKKQQAERREDIIPVNAQRVRRPAGRQKYQQRVQQQGQGPGLAAGLLRHSGRRANAASSAAAHHSSAPPNR